MARMADAVRRRVIELLQRVADGGVGTKLLAEAGSQVLPDAAGSPDEPVREDPGVIRDPCEARVVRRGVSPLHALRLLARPAPRIVVPLVWVVRELLEVVHALAVPLLHHAEGEVAHVGLDAAFGEHVEGLVELDGHVAVARHVDRRAVPRGLVLERVEGEEVDRQRAARHRQLRDVDVLRDGLQAEHAVEAERNADVDAVLECLRLFHRPAGQADDLVVDRAEALHADQQVADPRLLELLALLPLRQRDRVGDERGVEAYLVAVGDELADVTPDGGLAALDVDGGVAVLVAQVVADLLGLLEVHEGMLGMVLLLDPVEEVAEVAADVAGLAEPHDAPAREELLASLEVAVARRRSVNHRALASPVPSPAQGQDRGTRSALSLVAEVRLGSRPGLREDPRHVRPRDWRACCPGTIPTLVRGHRDPNAGLIRPRRRAARDRRGRSHASWPGLRHTVTQTDVGTLPTRSGTGTATGTGRGHAAGRRGSATHRTDTARDGRRLQEPAMAGPIEGHAACENIRRGPGVLFAIMRMPLPDAPLSGPLPVTRHRQQPRSRLHGDQRAQRQDPQRALPRDLCRQHAQARVDVLAHLGGAYHACEAVHLAQVERVVEDAAHRRVHHLGTRRVAS